MLAPALSSELTTHRNPEEEVRSPFIFLPQSAYLARIPLEEEVANRYLHTKGRNSRLALVIPSKVDLIAGRATKKTSCRLPVGWNCRV